MQSINYLAVLPTKVTLYTKISCVFCEKAKQLLQDNKIYYSEIYLDDPVIRNQFKTKYPSLKTVPQIFVDVDPNNRIATELIGGCNELQAYIDAVHADKENDKYGIFPLDTANPIA